MMAPIDTPARLWAAFEAVGRERPPRTASRAVEAGFRAFWRGWPDLKRIEEGGGAGGAAIGACLTYVRAIAIMYARYGHQRERRIGTMYERHRAGGNYLAEDAIAGRRVGKVKRRAHRLNVRVDEDLYRAIRAEAEASRLTLAQVMRLALASGIERVAAERIERQAIGGSE